MRLPPCNAGMRENEKAMLPFVISKELSKSFVDQMVDGIRDAIVGGHWRIGDRVPSLKAMSKLSKVSMKVPRTAYKRLENEGWLHAAPGIGYTVVTPNVSVWKGRVLLVLPLPGYYNRIMAKCIQDRLEAEGYLVTTFSPQTFNREIKSDALEALLLQKFDYIFSFLGFPEVRRLLKSSGVPYVIYSEVWQPGKAVGSDALIGDDGKGVDELISQCRARKVKDVLRVDFQNVRKGWDGLFRKAGVRVRYFSAFPIGMEPTLENIRQAAYETFRRYLSGRRPGFPDLFLFADDYVAEGALLAFAEAGLHAPDDFRFVSLVNEGLGVTYPRPVSRLVMNPVCAGDAAAAFILSALAGNSVEKSLPGLSFVPGETF